MGSEMCIRDSHYTRNHIRFLKKQVLRCFTSPFHPREAYTFSNTVTPTNRQVPGFPIRTPSDQRSVDNSPRTIAASHVLHQHDVPRHPLCAHKTKTLSQIFGRMLPVSNIRLATINKKYRRSRPLCSSHTTPPTPNHQTIPVSDGV